MSGWESLYTTGTAAVTNGSTSVVGTGTLWATYTNSSNVLNLGGLFVTVAAVVDDTHITLTNPWPGSTLSAQPYTLIQFAPASLSQSRDMTDFLGKVRAATPIYAVSGATPDPAIGNEGDYALKTNTGAWKQWLKTGGVWVLQATPVGVTNRGAWNSATTYQVNDIVSDAGSAYLSNTLNTNKQPSLNPTDWSVLGAKGDKGDAGTKGDVGAKGDTGARGTDGNTTRYGSGAPSNLLGNDGDFYIDIVADMNYGPKAAGTWPAGTSRRGATGAKGDTGTGLQPNATGTLAQRGAYDNQPIGFVFLETDVVPFLVWVKGSNTTADWSGPTPIGGTAPLGSMGSVADAVTSSFSCGSIA